MKFAHLSDVHLGGWKEEELTILNQKAFSNSIDIIIERKLDFVLIAGDFFNNSYPSIEVLKNASKELNRLRENNIPVFIILGSHDSSASNRTFIDVLEAAGLCKNIQNVQDNIIVPHIFRDIAIYGYKGKKNGLEVQDLRNFQYEPTDTRYKILMLHTTLDVVVGDVPMDSLESNQLPEMDYYALGHIHVRYNKDQIVYPGPIFPNNFPELENLEYGSFVIHDTETEQNEFIELKQKEVFKIEFDIKNNIDEIPVFIPENKIVLLRVIGKGKINSKYFDNMKELAKTKNSILLVNKNKLKDVDIVLNHGMEKIQTPDLILKEFIENNPSEFNVLFQPLMDSLNIEKQPGEKKAVFEKRLIDDAMCSCDKNKIVKPKGLNTITN